MVLQWRAGIEGAVSRATGRECKVIIKVIHSCIPYSAPINL